MEVEEREDNLEDDAQNRRKVKRRKDCRKEKKNTHKDYEKANIWSEIKEREH